VGPRLVGLAIIGLVVALVVIQHLSSRSSRTKRKLGRYRQFSIGDLPARRIGRIAGMVTPVGRPLVAPLSGRACVYYRTRIVHSRLSGTDFSSETTLLDKTEIVPFAIDDGTGHALVDVTRTRVAVETDLRDVTSKPNDLDARQAALLAAHAISPTGIVLSKTLVFTEELIEPGERIAAVGVCLPDPTPPSERPGVSPYREAQRTAAPRKVRLAASRSTPLLLTDDQALAPPLDDDH
jgi:hypothetical protein